MAGGADTDVVVVGAGLAGLACARTLERAGLDVVVLERGDAVGGRVRTDVVDGFRCDRGFQLLNPAYPAVRRLVDVGALRLGTFEAGVAVRRGDGPGGLAVVADPRRAPALAAATVRSGYLQPGELARLARWVAPALGPVSRLRDAPDTTLAASLDAAGVTGALRHEVLERFLTGVLADDTGRTSAAFVRLLLRSFLVGTPGVPAHGMQALPEQLAAGLARPVRLGVWAAAVGREGRVETPEGPLSARAVVVATDAVDAQTLTGLGSDPMRGLRTWWFAADTSPEPRRLLVVDAHGGPVVNTAVLTAAAPTYAPPGRSLVQATTLLPSVAGEAEVRRHLDRLWGTSTAGWELVTRHDVDRALPEQSAPLRARRRVALGEGLFVCGDHRDTASIQGALVSGRRTARAVLADLRAA
jgi:phytoene dehydrogenase-like protein